MDSIQAGLQMMLDRGELLKALRSFKRGDFSARMPLNLTGIDGEIAQTFNDVVELEEAKAAEIARVADLVGKEGQTASRMSVPGATGAWLEVIESINTLINDLSYPMTEVARVIGSVAKGDLSHTMVLEADGPSAARRSAAPRHGGQHDGRDSSTRSPPRSRAWRARSAPKASSAGRRRLPAWLAYGRTSPTT